MRIFLSNDHLLSLISLLILTVSLEDLWERRQVLILLIFFLKRLIS